LTRDDVMLGEWISADPRMRDGLITHSALDGLQEITQEIARRPASHMDWTWRYQRFLLPAKWRMSMHWYCSKSAYISGIWRNVSRPCFLFSYLDGPTGGLAQPTLRCWIAEQGDRKHLLDDLLKGRRDGQWDFRSDSKQRMRKKQQSGTRRRCAAHKNSVYSSLLQTSLGKYLKRFAPEKFSTRNRARKNDRVAGKLCRRWFSGAQPLPEWVSNSETTLDSHTLSGFAIMLDIRFSIGRWHVMKVWPKFPREIGSFRFIEAITFHVHLIGQS